MPLFYQSSKYIAYFKRIDCPSSHNIWLWISFSLVLLSFYITGHARIYIVGTLGCVFIDNETHESGVTQWSAFSWHHSSVFQCQC